MTTAIKFVMLALLWALVTFALGYITILYSGHLSEAGKNDFLWMLVGRILIWPVEFFFVVKNVILHIPGKHISISGAIAVQCAIYIAAAVSLALFSWLNRRQ